jgi:large subunit ribosomal protein L10
MEKSKKVESVTEIKELVGNASSMYLIDYRGVNVADISELRRNFLKEGVTYKVFKNTLFKRALNEVGGYDKLDDKLEGMTGVAFVGENFVAPAKIIKKYFDDTKKFKFKGCYIDEEFYDEDKLNLLASMPTKEEVMSSIVGSVAAPASGIVGAISAVMRDLASVIGEISKKQAA